MAIPSNKMTLGASERLKSRKQIELLFARGKGVSAFPVKIIYRLHEEESEYPLKMMVTVPKRKFKRAVDRNLLKRRVREAYRQEKKTLHEALPPGFGMDLAILYLAPEIRDFNEIQEKLVLSLHRLAKAIGSDKKS